MTELARSRSLPSDALERALDRAAGSRLIPGNRVEPLFDGPAALAAMLQMIGSAARWVHFDNYIFRDDATGQAFADALAERARAGVSVRVSTDWLGSFGTRRRFWNSLRQSGAMVERFNPPQLLDPPLVLSRNHRKLVVADGCRAIVGGLCVGNEWAGDRARGRLPWRDTAVLLEGPAAVALDQAFAQTWALANEPVPPTETAASVEPIGDAYVRVIAGAPGREHAYRATELLTAAAARRVWVTDAYLVAPRRLYRYLIDAARDGVDVRLLVPGTSDLPFVRNLTRFGYRDLLRAGVRIYEWTGPMLHAKTLVVDGLWSRIGSSNLNHSSLIGNYELDVLVESRELADRMEAQFRRDLDQSAEVITRPVRAPRRLQQMLPAALAIHGPEHPGPHHRPGLRERRGESVLVLRTLAASARLAIFGPIALVLVVLAVLFFFVPVVMAGIFGLLSFWLAGLSAAAALRRRTEPGSRSR